MQREIYLGGYIVVFAIIHSLTAANFFKKAVHRFIDPERYRLLYTIFSLVTVLPIIYLWFWDRDSSPFLYMIPFPYSLFSYGLIILGIALIINSFMIIDLFEFIGLKKSSKIEADGKGLITSGSYGLTRHPLYFGGMLILWANPGMRMVDLTVALFFSLYFIVGAFLEERKLEEEFGQSYRDYKKRVSMFLPLKWVVFIIRS
jgi:protein-S-isoprenylcysteine O-methyltransferase Ste14